MESSKQDQNFSGYGTYDISDKLELRLPKTYIHTERKSDGRLSYYRKNSEYDEIRKSIPQSGKNVKIELCPVLPLHLPAKKTNDMIFLRLAESIFVGKQSTVNVLIQFPIEIGIFIINSNDGTKELFDCFTCEPMHSRFALYGTPEKGSLCMYSKVKLLEEDELDPYIFAKMRITLTNELGKGVFVGKLVFSITNHTIYYLKDSSEVHIDDIKGTVRQSSNEEIIEINRENYSKKDRGWKTVSYSNEKKDIGFLMDKGFD